MALALDQSQSRALSLFHRGLNVSVLGRAGSGKSVLLKLMIASAKQRWPDGSVAVVALSGSAALGVGGQTIHRLFGWDVRPLSKQRWLAETLARKDVCARLNRLRVLFVEEAATMSSSLFSRMAFVMRRVAPEHLQGLPFGGCQVVCASDVLQGAPVKVTDFSTDGMVFNCPEWRSTFHTYRGQVVCTTGAHRQQDDASFRDLLDKIRWGSHSSSDIDAVNSTWERHPVGSDGITQLRIKKVAVQDLNCRKLAAIDNPLVTFPSEVTVVTAKDLVKDLAIAQLRDVVEPTVWLKATCPVILTRAVGQLPTGTRGHVVGFETRPVAITPGFDSQSSMYVVCDMGGKRVAITRQRFSVHDTDGSELLFTYQLPLLLGWTITVHRAQGMTLDAVEIDFSSDTWSTCGLVYSALSRCRSFSGLRVRGLKRGLVRVSSEARYYMSKQMADNNVLDQEAARWVVAV